jgi:hypothetical protein
MSPVAAFCGTRFLPTTESRAVDAYTGDIQTFFAPQIEELLAEPDGKGHDKRPQQYAPQEARNK